MFRKSLIIKTELFYVRFQKHKTVENFAKKIQDFFGRIMKNKQRNIQRLGFFVGNFQISPAPLQLLLRFSLDGKPYIILSFSSHFH